MYRKKGIFWYSVHIKKNWHALMCIVYCKLVLRLNKIATIKMRNNFYYPLKMVIFPILQLQYLTFIAPHLVIALPTLWQQKLLFLISFLKFCRLVHGFFSVLLPYNYRSSNYCDSNSCCSFTLLKALAKSNGNLLLSKKLYQKVCKQD